MSHTVVAREGPFTESEIGVIVTIANAIIPPDGARELPGGGDPDVLPVLLSKASVYADRIKAGIETLGGRSELHAADPELVGAVLRDERHRPFVRLLTIAVIQAYYQDPRVLRAHGLPDRPPYPQGHELDPGDWSLLEPVRQRAPFARKA